MRKAVIILPTYNEFESVESVINKIFAEAKNNPNWELHVLVVDSHSPDGTGKKVSALIKKYPSLHLLSTKKEGLGKAYIEGFKEALDKLNPYLFFEMDADAQHDPKEISNFLRKIEKGADFVIGARYIKGGSIPEDWGIHRKILSASANTIIRLGFMKLNIHDWTDGYRAIKAWIVKSSLNHINDYSGYVFQIALLDFAVKSKARIDEIPVKFSERIHGRSKINSLQYIVQSLWYVFTHSSFIKFAIVGFLGFVVDFGISFALIEKLKYLVWISTLISAETAIIFNFFMNNYWSFAHKKLEHKLSAYLPSFLKFNLVSSGSLLIQVVGLQLLVSLFGKKLWYLYKVLIIAFIIIPYSYILYNKFIWKEE